MLKYDLKKIPAAALAKMMSNEKPEVIDNTDLVNEFRSEGGHVFHMRPSDYGDRGLTIAYKQKSGRVEIATALQHRADDFTKKMGTKVAIEHFKAGKTVVLPCVGYERPIDGIRAAMALLV